MAGLLTVNLESRLTIGDLAALQKVDALGYDYVDGWLRPRRSWRRWLLAKLTALLSDHEARR